MRILKLLPAVILSAAIAAPAYAQPGQSLPHTMVYKTNGNYSKLVQVELSADGSKIMSYPAPSDVHEANLPVKLKKGYWLSKTGISDRTAFLKTTTSDYSKQKEVADTELYKEIRDKSPLVELWDCGTRGAMTNGEINTLIRKKKLASKCKRIK